MNNLKVVHIKNITADAEELRDRLTAICKEHGIEITSEIKDTFTLAYNSEAAMIKLIDLRNNLEISGKKIIITKEGL